MKANKISLNVSKTEFLLFHNINKPINYNLKIKLDGKRIYLSKFVKYLGLLIDSHLNWGYHTKSLATKLTRAVGMLAKLRHFVSKSTLRNIYFGIFSSLLTYGSQIWGQYVNRNVKRIIKIQNKALKIINFANYCAPTSILYKDSNILKFSDHVTLHNFLYVHDITTRRVPSPLEGTLAFSYDKHNHLTRHSIRNCVELPKSRTIEYGIHSITSQSARSWNSLQVTCFKQNSYISPRNVRKSKFKKYMIDSY